MKKWLFITCILFTTSCLASVELILKPNPAAIDEEVQLIIKQTGNSSRHSSGLPDVSLLAQDFQIVGTQQSMSYQVLNGSAQQENIWTIILLPKHIGNLNIPALKIGDEMTQPQVLQVQKGKSIISNNHAQEEKMVFLNWSIEPHAPMLHEQVKIKLKIYHQVPLLDAKLSPPSVNNALLFSIDNHQHDVQIVEGRKYEVETYEYLFYPQKVGALKIYPPILDALQYDLMPTPIHLSLPYKKLIIKAPIDVDKNIKWLPAAHLSYEELTPINNIVKLNLGETLTRRIKVTGVGVPANLITDLQVSCGEQCKVYSHLLDTKNKLVNDELSGTKTFEITYLPKVKGDLKIPEIKISWFNTKTRLPEVLNIPGMLLSVLPENQMPSSILETDSEIQATTFHLPTWLSLVLGLLVGMFVMKLWGKLSYNSLWSTIRQIEFKNRALKLACLKNDAMSVRNILIQWAKQHIDNDCRDLHDIHDRITDVEFKCQIELLVAYLFQNNPNKLWDGKLFWQAFKKFKKIKSAKVQKNVTLNSLNPS